MSESIAKLNFVCPQCNAVNRVPSNRTSDGPVCGKCKSQLLTCHPVELDDRSFDKFIQRTEVPVVVDFWASWCGPCRAMAHQFAQAADSLSPEVLLAKLNTEDNRVAGRFNISGIPCLILFRNGKETARQSGMMDAKQIVQWIRNSLAKN